MCYPGFEFLFGNLARCEALHELNTFGRLSDEAPAVQAQKSNTGYKGCPLVAVDECVRLCDAKGIAYGTFKDVGISYCHLLTGLCNAF